MGYRPDIDGLRAVAVLSVIVFHIDPRLLGGGFIGVDIFFVISGYLISLYILSELSDGRFSLAEFYRRRVKRIAPAMIVVVTTIVVLSQVFFRPVDAVEAAKSGLWSLLSAANVYFWLAEDNSYFAAASDDIPLLHIWSLGVEEQFYLLWPLAVLLLYRWKVRVTVAILFVAAILSFAFAEFWYSNDPSFVFFMLPSRAGELLLGALLALIVKQYKPDLRSAVWVATIAIGGAVLLFASLFLIDSQDRFPGILAIPPSLGTAMLIFAGGQGRSLPTRLLENRLLVGVGKISYSAYLWHWPILAFLRYANVDIDVASGTAAFGLTVFLSILTYRYVERPCRASSKPFWAIMRKQAVYPAIPVLLIVMVSLGTDGFAHRAYDEEFRRQVNTLQVKLPKPTDYEYICQKSRLELADLADERCVLGPVAGKTPDLMLWGDSNAAHYVGMLGAFADHADYSFRNIAVGACPPLFDGIRDFVRIDRLEDCEHSSELIWQHIEPYDTVVISAIWVGYARYYEGFLPQFEKTIKTLIDGGHNIILLGNAPIAEDFDRTCREKALKLPFINCPTSFTLGKEVVAANRELQKMADRYVQVSYFDANFLLCPGGECKVYDSSGIPLYYDAFHLNVVTSWKLGQDVVSGDGLPKVFADALARK